MKKTLLLLSGIFLMLSSCNDQIDIPIEHKKSGAAKAMEEWGLVRSYPDGRIQTRNLVKAYEAQEMYTQNRDNDPEWEALGPKNIGGRTLCVAFHPEDENIQYIGSASGGLWKTTTAGQGVEAWERIPLGHPVLGVSSIAIDPNDPDVMYIGTGEVYNYNIAAPGVYNRLTRGSYGMGLLKTTDGGANWEKSIDWSYTDLKGVWDVVINPINTNTVFAATTEGLYRTHDAGDNWDLIYEYTMGVDIEMHPVDTNIVFVTFGGYQSPQQGVFKSEDGGDTFEAVVDLPNDYTGKSLFSISPSNPDIMYISVGDALEGRGLFRSDDGGDSWDLVNDANIPTYQGWFSHDVGIKPDDPNTVLWAGVETYKSTDAGANFTKKTFWSAWFFGDVPVGGPEGPPNYAHADIHAIYYAPFDPNTIFMATDGGIFVSEDNGESWEGRNGGYQTQQFYARFSSSATDPNLAMGGLQDNATAIYQGDDSWVRVIGGDGMGTAIHPENSNILYGSAQNLNMRVSYNGGENFQGVFVSSAENEARNFNGPFILSPNNPNIVYAGAQRLHISENGGEDWEPTSLTLVDAQFANPILSIAVSPTSDDLIYVTTAPLLSGSPGVFRSENGGGNWAKMQGLPDRVGMEVTFQPGSPDTAYAVFSGFGSEHLYRTIDAGDTWEAIGEGLPDIPTSTVVVDPEIGSDIYVGTDLGVYASFDYGATFEPYSYPIAGAVMVMHLSISPVNRKLRIASHGMGVYQTDLRDPEVVSGTAEPSVLHASFGSPYPNPVKDMLQIPYELEEALEVDVALINSTGQYVKMLMENTMVVGKSQLELPMSDMPKGIYYVKITTNDESMNVMHKVIKQ